MISSFIQGIKDLLWGFWGAVLFFGGLWLLWWVPLYVFAWGSQLLGFGLMPGVVVGMVVGFVACGGFCMALTRQPKQVITVTLRGGGISGGDSGDGVRR